MLQNSRLRPKSLCRWSISATWLLGLALAARGQNVPTITTVAGGGPLDNGLATKSAVGFPANVAADANGNIYISDIGHNLIRKADSGGIITTVAGNGTPGFSGDGGPAIKAQINSPAGLATDAHGNLFFADVNNNRVRKVDAAGVITTVAGNGTSSFSGDGGPATSASLAFTSPNGPGPRPYLAVDQAGNLFIADSFNFRIRKVDLSGVINTVAGTTRGFSGDGGLAVNAQFSFLAGLAIDSNGNLFIADAGNDRVRRVDSSGIINTFAGDGIANFGGDGGAATQAALNSPEGLAVDALGNLFIADTTNERIRKVDTKGIISTVAGNGTQSYGGDGGPAGSAMLNSPGDVAVDPLGNFFIADGFNFRIRKVDTGATIATVAGTGEANFSGDGASATGAILDHPVGVAADAAGNFFISDTLNGRVRKVDGSGAINTVLLLLGGVFPGEARTFGSVVDSAGSLFVSGLDINGTILQELGANGAVTTVLSAPNNGSLIIGGDVAVEGSGFLFTSDQCIHKLDAAGNVTTVAGTCFPQFHGGISCASGQATTAHLNNPQSVAVDSSGNFFVTDTNRVCKVDTNGMISTVVGDGTPGFTGDGGPALNARLNGPAGIRIANDNLFIADQGNQRIRKVDVLGIIRTVAGNGSEGFSGDGGPATSASLDSPSAVAVDGNGNLLIADTNNSRIRKVTLPDFALTASPASATIRAGQSANITLTVAPRNGFAGSISFACSGLPAFSSCTFNPASLTPNGTPVNVTLTVHTSGQNAALYPPQSPQGGGEIARPALALWALGPSLGTLGLAVAAGRRKPGRSRRRAAAMLGAMLLLAVVGCAGGGSVVPPPSPQTTPPGTSTMTVTATAADGSAVNLASISLTVTQ